MTAFSIVDYWAKIEGGNSTQRFHAWHNGATLCSGTRHASQPSEYRRSSQPHRTCTLCLRAMQGTTRFSRLNNYGAPIA